MCFIELLLLGLLEVYAYYLGTCRRILGLNLSSFMHVQCIYQLTRALSLTRLENAVARAALSL